MPIRTRLQAAPVARVDAVSAFRWSDNGDGLSHMLGYPCFSTRAAAARAWHRVRRAVWATTPRFTVPLTATVFDGVTIDSLEFIRWEWNVVGAFDRAGARAALAVDRAHLVAFEHTRAARSIRDYLDLFRADLDTIARTADTLATIPDGVFRPYPSPLHTAATYGTAGAEAPRDEDR